MPRHATERSLSVNALKKRSAGKSITPVLSPNQPSEWWWGWMAHSLKQGILGRANGISLRFSPGASRPRSSAARHSRQDPHIRVLSSTAAPESGLQPPLRIRIQVPHHCRAYGGASLVETLGEDSPLATSMPATPATEVQPEDHRNALDRKVLQKTPVLAMAQAQTCHRSRKCTKVASEPN